MLTLTERKDNIQRHPLSKLFIWFFIPIFLGFITKSLIDVFVHILVGRITNEIYLTGLSVITPVLTFITQIGTFIGLGAASLISLKLGDNNIENAKKAFYQCVFSLMIIGIIAIFLLQILNDNIVLMILRGKSDSSVFPIAKDYLRIVSISLFFSYKYRHSVLYNRLWLSLGRFYINIIQCDN